MLPAEQILSYGQILAAQAKEVGKCVGWNLLVAMKSPISLGTSVTLASAPGGMFLGTTTLNHSSLLRNAPMKERSLMPQAHQGHFAGFLVG